MTNPGVHSRKQGLPRSPGIGQLIVVGALLVSGCVRRTVTVRTDPQDAAVILNDQHIGTSPVSVDFTWYGDYSVIIKKDGYETINTHQRLNAPWYQLPPIDFFAEALTPFWLHDQQQMFFKMEPAKPIDHAELIRQAHEFQDRALFEGEHASTSRPASRPAK